MAEAASQRRHRLDPEVLSRITSLELRARMIVEGYYTGLHRSPYHGASVEYADHRVYTQGDDLRHIDWKVFARTDKYYIKEYEQETNLQCLLAVDCSESMNYRSSSAAMSKYEYASTVAASLAYLAIHRQRDSVGLVLFDDRIRHMLRPSRNPGQFRAIVRDLQTGTGPAKTGLQRVLDDLAESARAGGQRVLVVLLSDLFDDPDAIVRGLSHLRFRRNEVIVISVWDDAEYDFPFRGATLFDGLEQSGRLLAEPRSLRERYLEEVRRFAGHLRQQCHRLQVDYAPFRTSAPVDVALSTYLATRSAQIRRRASRVLGSG